MKTILHEIVHELVLAERKHPSWPDDPIHQVAIMVEEAGEAMQAALQMVYENGSVEALKKELIQTGAMVVRCLENLDENPELLEGEG
jgi:hypothetical protein